MASVAELDVPTLDSPAVRVLIESALAYAGGTHTVADVEDAITRGDAQLWTGPNSCIVTEIDRQPRHSILCFWLTAGVSSELEAMEPGVVEWGKSEGCDRARLVGRKGWERSFLPSHGWFNIGHVIMEREIK